MTQILEQTDDSSDLRMLYDAVTVARQYDAAAAAIVSQYPGAQLVYIEDGGKIPNDRLIGSIKKLDSGFPVVAVGLKVSQYRGGMTATDDFEVGPTDHIAAYRHTILVDDIKDRGGTLAMAVRVLRPKAFKSLRYFATLERSDSPPIPGLEALVPPLPVPKEIDGVEPWVVGNGCKDARKGRAFNRELWEVMYFPKPN